MEPSICNFVPMLYIRVIAFRYSLDHQPIPDSCWVSAMQWLYINVMTFNNAMPWQSMCGCIYSAIMTEMTTMMTTMTTMTTRTVTMLSMMTTMTIMMMIVQNYCPRIGRRIRGFVWVCMVEYRIWVSRVRYSLNNPSKSTEKRMTTPQFFKQ